MSVLTINSDIEEQYTLYCLKCEDLTENPRLPDYRYKITGRGRMIEKLEMFIKYFVFKIKSREQGSSKSDYQKLNRCKAILQELRTEEIIEEINKASNYTKK